MSNCSYCGYSPCGCIDKPWGDRSDLEIKIKALESKNGELERKLSSIINECIAENAYEYSQYCQSMDYGYTKQIKALEAKNAELENQLKLSNEFVDIWRDKAIELEKKLEAVEMVHSNYVNVSCDLYSTLEKKLEIAVKSLEFYGNIENWRNHTHPKGFKFSQLDSEGGSDFGQFKNNTILISGDRARKALAAINGEGV